MNEIRPRKIQNVSIQQVGAELLIYDETRHKAFCLNGLSAAIWKRCNGNATVQQIAAAATLELCVPVTRDSVLASLRSLEDEGLLEVELNAALVHSTSRRQLIQRLGVGSVMMVPVIASILAPKAAQAYSGCVDCNAVPGPRANLETRQRFLHQQQMIAKQRQANEFMKSPVEEPVSPQLFKP